MIVHETFPATDDAPAHARQLVRSVIDRDPRAAVAQVAISELVTNAIVHGRLDPHERIEVHVDLAATVLRITVLNRGGGFDTNRVRAPDAPGGWGLAIVAGVASAWGARTMDDRTVVWFEL